MQRTPCERVLESALPKFTYVGFRSSHPFVPTAYTTLYACSLYAPTASYSHTWVYCVLFLRQAFPLYEATTRACAYDDNLSPQASESRYLLSGIYRDLLRRANRWDPRCPVGG